MGYKFFLILIAMFLLSGCYNAGPDERKDIDKNLEWDSRRGDNKAYIRHGDPSPMPMKSGKQGPGLHSPTRLL
jgi:hypothetical protein